MEQPVSCEKMNRDEDDHAWKQIECWQTGTYSVNKITLRRIKALGLHTPLLARANNTSNKHNEEYRTTTVWELWSAILITITIITLW